MTSISLALLSSRTAILVTGLALVTMGHVNAQRTYIVSHGVGHFTQIAAAIRAAAVGDRIEVLGGTYRGFTLDNASPSSVPRPRSVRR